MNDSTQAQYNYFFQKLMQAENPKNMLYEFEKLGNVYISEFMIQIINRSIGRDLQDMNMLLIGNPKLTIDEIDVDFRKRNAKAEKIKELFESRVKEKKEIPIKIEKLDTESLKYSDVIYDYYLRNYNFMYCQSDNYKNIPIIENASIYIDGNKNKFGKFTWIKYFEGFSQEYKKGLPKVNDNKSMLFNIRTRIKPNPFLPTVSYDKERKPYFDKQYAFEYGVNMAKSFLAWEYIINNLPEIEDNLFTQKTEPETSTGKREQKENLPPKWTKENIFKNLEYLQKVIDELISDNVLNQNGEFLGKKNEILAITEALQILGIIQPNVNKTKRNLLFAELVKTKMSERTATAEIKGEYKKGERLHGDKVTYFIELFSQLT